MIFFFSSTNEVPMLWSASANKCPVAFSSSVSGCVLVSDSEATFAQMLVLFRIFSHIHWNLQRKLRLLLIEMEILSSRYELIRRDKKINLDDKIRFQFFFAASTILCLINSKMYLVFLLGNSLLQFNVAFEHSRKDWLCRIYHVQIQVPEENCVEMGF